LRGGCHCGHVRVELGTDIAPAEFHPRACDCAFCMKHGASYISDPRGRLSIQVRGSETINEYRQGTGSARFLVCRRCGVLVAVMFDGVAGSFGAVNSRCIEGDVAFGTPQTVSPQRLDGEEKRRRWEQLWTPHATLTVLPA
jgi:hypothetical protein